MKICPKCESVQSNNMRFCSECGWDLKYSGRVNQEDIRNSDREIPDQKKHPSLKRILTVIAIVTAVTMISFASWMMNSDSKDKAARVYVDKIESLRAYVEKTDLEDMESADFQKYCSVFNGPDYEENSDDGFWFQDNKLKDYDNIDRNRKHFMYEYGEELVITHGKDDPNPTRFEEYRSAEIDSGDGNNSADGFRFIVQSFINEEGYYLVLIDSYAMKNGQFKDFYDEEETQILASSDDFDNQPVFFLVTKHR